MIYQGRVHDIPMRYFIRNQRVYVDPMPEQKLRLVCTKGQAYHVVTLSKDRSQKTGVLERKRFWSRACSKEVLFMGSTLVFQNKAQPNPQASNNKKVDHGSWGFRLWGVPKKN